MERGDDVLSEIAGFLQFAEGIVHFCRGVAKKSPITTLGRAVVGDGGNADATVVTNRKRD
ncbi:hypothetical protein ABLE94_18205 [Gordonia sp. VNK1]|uniref:hypothetical protein n=1 Tax=Gordonia oleivorans TaxID=3156618 RepID=UPI0032B44CE0